MDKSVPVLRVLTDPEAKVICLKNDQKDLVVVLPEQVSLLIGWLRDARDELEDLEEPDPNIVSTCNLHEPGYQA